MRIDTVETYQANAEAQKALAHFEASFTYPLQTDEAFRISHAPDYSAFYRSLGHKAQSLVAIDDALPGKIIASLAAAECDLYSPSGHLHALYLGDLKIHPKVRGGTALWRLACSIKQAYPQHTLGFSVVMQGTPITPRNYAGRAGLPAFEPTQTVGIIAINLQGLMPQSSNAYITTTAQDSSLFTQLAQDYCYLHSTHPFMRSKYPPIWFVDAQAEACGRLEDTLLAKRLFHHQQGHELLNAHLARFVYTHTEAAYRVLSAASLSAKQLGFTQLFCCIKACDIPAFAAHFGDSLSVKTQADIFTSGTFPFNKDNTPIPWILSSSEI